MKGRIGVTEYRCVGVLRDAEKDGCEHTRAVVVKPWSRNRSREAVVVSTVVMLMFAWAASTPGAECSINGELSGWLTYAHDAEDDLTAGLRYVPEASLSQYVTERLELSLDVAVRLDTFAPVDELSELGDNDDLDLYRAWLRLASDRMELRAGLQKINFGSASGL